MNDGLDFIRNHLLSEGEVTQDLLDYIDDRIRAIVQDRLAQCMGDLEETMMERINSLRIKP